MLYTSFLIMKLETIPYLREETALSKCYKMIDRFSEDIDLVVLRREGETDNKLKTKIKVIGNVVSEGLPEVEI